MASSPAFRLFGFPVHIRTGYWLFILLVVGVNGIELGLWFALFMTVLLLVHELGHAFAARLTGARAEITLDLFAGYASFTPTRPLRWWEQAGISAAGPAAQFTVGVGALLAAGYDPASTDHAGWPAPVRALWFAGPVIALFNLIPALPLDGGHIVQAFLTPVLGHRAQRITLLASVAITVGAYIWMTTAARWNVSPIFLIFPLMAQIQMLRADGNDANRQIAMTKLAAAEATAWRTGEIDQFPSGGRPSPWFLAMLQLRSGHAEHATRILTEDLTNPHSRNWWPPPVENANALTALVDALPRPYPSGNPHGELVLASILHGLRRHDDAARYGAAAFGTHREPAVALVVSRAAAALGDRPTAVAWLRTALHEDPSGGVAEVAAQTPEVAALLDEATTPASPLR